MRVLFWSSIYWPHIGGVQVLACRLLPALAKRGYEFVVLTEQGGAQLPAWEDVDGIAVRRFPFADGLRDVDRLASLRAQLVKLRQSFAPDLCHTVALGPTDFFQRITQGPDHPTPWLASLFGQWPSQYTGILRETIQRADWITCDSAQTLEFSRSIAPDATAPQTVIRNAIEVPRVAPAPLPEAPRLLVAGRLSSEKGVDLALRAFVQVLRRCPHARLTIAGDGPERSSLEKLAIELGINDSAEFLGWIDPDEIPGLLNAASMLILPSRADSFPLIALEAALMERPVVAARVGGLPEMVVHGVTGLLTQAESPAALADAVIRLAESPDAAAALGRAARRHVQDRYRFSEMVDAYDDTYRRTIRQASKRRAGGGD